MKSDITTFRKFIQSDIWADIKEHLQEELLHLQIELETCGPGTGISVDRFPFEVVHLQAKIATLRDMLDLPTAIIEDLEELSKFKEARNEPTDRS